MNISVMQWNIWYKEDIRHVADFLTRHTPDIVCLQELTVGSNDQPVMRTPEYIAEQLGYHSYYKELPIEGTDGTKMMLANGIFSRFPITARHFAWINEPKERGGYDDEYRAYVEVSVDIQGKELSVGTTHMSYTHRFEPTPHKRSETDALVDHLKVHDARFIFTGDLNAYPGSYTIDSIERFMKNAGPDMDQKTWTTKPFSYQGFEETELHWRLDYVFATKDIAVVDSKVIATDYSDHLPILTTFEV